VSEAIFTADNVVKHFGGVRAVENVSLQVNAGAIHAIIGPNGAGAMAAR